MVFYHCVCGCVKQCWVKLNLGCYDSQIVTKPLSLPLHIHFWLNCSLLFSSVFCFLQCVLVYMWIQLLAPPLNLPDSLPPSLMAPIIPALKAIVSIYLSRSRECSTMKLMGEFKSDPRKVKQSNSMDQMPLNEYSKRNMA